jgi:putative ABC transport system substrate-binding protein
MRRREFMILLGAPTAVWSIGAAAQERRPMRQIGVLMGTANDAEGQSRLTTFVQRLQELGWTEGHNVRIVYRWTSGRSDLIQPLAKEIVETATGRHSWPHHTCGRRAP